MPNNDFEKKNIMLPKIAFQNLGTTKLHLGSQDPGSRKFSCPAGEPGFGITGAPTAHDANAKS